ncbi:uncharacterized protein LMH87_007598 [Akanthomyces muscarius]|uniref:Uncharacterized protein n=1 Tax=Akanthomyces muscarius TaxID=2231603 RepID=A0A9W8QKJ3_AKAMU|nr:uncharacterized protein LMH87_007598 [Akanthomyces muscarius]KAJ4161566.1 hypothetical protein LMH87_007598 [Akanthomyces muscarius]
MGPFVDLTSDADGNEKRSALVPTIPSKYLTHSVAPFDQRKDEWLEGLRLQSVDLAMDMGPYHVAFQSKFADFKSPWTPRSYLVKLGGKRIWIHGQKLRNVSQLEDGAVRLHSRGYLWGQKKLNAISRILFPDRGRLDETNIITNRVVSTGVYVWLGASVNRLDYQYAYAFTTEIPATPDTLRQPPHEYPSIKACITPMDSFQEYHGVPPPKDGHFESPEARKNYEAEACQFRNCLLARNGNCNCLDKKIYS